jgi:hypothetical protein
MRKLIWLALFYVMVSHAESITKPIDGQIGFDSMDAAASEALENCSKISDKKEYGGVILEMNGRYYYTSFISGSDKEIGSFKIALWKGSKVVGLYHTHPIGFNSDIFSSEDVKFADEKNWTSYVGVLGNHLRIIRYVPGKTAKVIKRHLMSEGAVSDGESVSAT